MYKSISNINIKIIHKESKAQVLTNENVLYDWILIIDGLIALMLLLKVLSLFIYWQLWDQ